MHISVSERMLNFLAKAKFCTVVERNILHNGMLQISIKHKMCYYDIILVNADNKNLINFPNVCQNIFWK